MTIGPSDHRLVGDLPRPRLLPDPFHSGVTETWLVRVSPRSLDRAPLALDETEMRRLGAFGYQPRALTFATGRIWLRILLGRRLGLPPWAVALAVAGNGRPHIDPAGGGGLDVSLSASGGWVLIGIGKGVRVGVDIQARDDRIDTEAAASLICSAEEQVWLRDSADRIRAFYALWTQKESLLKALGVGFREDPRALTIPALVRGGADRCGVLPDVCCAGLDLGATARMTAAVTMLGRRPDAGLPGSAKSAEYGAMSTSNRIASEKVSSGYC